MQRFDQDDSALPRKPVLCGGVHYPGDVVAGWMLALLAFAAAGAPGA
ncbi:MAG TPA: hypothetical protein VF665_03865 [Longimicrobium sp.]